MSETLPCRDDFGKQISKARFGFGADGRDYPPQPTVPT
jgi:hypothetical protein